MVLLGSEVIVGAGNVPRAPRASMRPYPKVPSGGLLPSWVAPPCSAATSWDTVRLGNALRISAATAPAFGADATVTSFAIVVLGSLGNPLGTALGGVVYGVCYMLVQTYLSSWADLLPYVLLIFILLLRPSGLLGRRVRVA